MHTKTVALAESLTAVGLTLSSHEFFDTIRVMNVDAEAVWQKARAHGITMLKVDDSTIGISVDETTSEATLNAIAHAFGAELVTIADASRVSNYARTTSYLTPEVFNSHHSETSMLRYLKRLADYD